MAGGRGGAAARASARGRRAGGRPRNRGAEHDPVSDEHEPARGEHAETPPHLVRSHVDHAVHAPQRDVSPAECDERRAARAGCECERRAGVEERRHFVEVDHVTGDGRKLRRFALPLEDLVEAPVDAPTPRRRETQAREPEYGQHRECKERERGPEDRHAGFSPQSSACSSRIGLLVKRYSLSSLESLGSWRRIHSSTMAACSFSSSRLCARIAFSSRSLQASTRCAYQSTASSSSISETIARCISRVSWDSSSTGSWYPSLDIAQPPRDAAQRRVRRNSAAKSCTGRYPSPATALSTT